jgi:FSR family fosmidomycin resistance protein-like MFS transporter
MRKLPLALMVLSHTVVDIAQNILPVVLPLLQDQFSLDYSEVGAAAALLSVSSSMIQPVFGWISDRWPTRWFLPAGILWTGIFMGLVGIVPSYWALLLVIACTGLGTAAFHPVASMVVAQASQAQRGFGMSFFSAGGNLGSALGPIVAAGLLGWFQLRGTLAMVIPCLLTAAAVHAWRNELATPLMPREPKAKPDSVPVPWKRLSVLCVLITLRSWASSGLVIFLPLLLHEQGVPLPVTARVLFVFLFCGALGGLLGGHLSDRVGRMQIIATSLLLFPFLMALALLTGGPLGWIILALAGMALLASYSVTVVFAQEMLPGNLGVASGLTLGLSFGAGGVGVALSGILADIIGLSPSVWMLLVLPGIAGLLALSLGSVRGPGRL